ncbi:hypothetical protein Q4E93_31055 [Flavitalea sp. BT771]|uniref:hypothetical protein n=1 Tax=Flavitalea sp. BT771 TaxID=3063329 RepID=UPI0026E3D05E|nr:hypothetical protein [Flavitalea sp. BT771]MDO6435095.1 hypothetical protein [Flavitalea sp. BT771]MDV6223995.1 hypothetical protein [Flavitalea sp. BT771]
MKRLSLSALVLFVLFSISCKKFIQQQEQKAVMAIITNGYWHVEQYLQNDSNITATFSGYLFKFDADGKVTGTKDNVSQTGSWSANVDARTITSNFPSATPPVSLLNGIWKIKDSGSDFVLATYTDTTLDTSNTLRLKK